MFNHSHRSLSRAFTLIEILIVIVILGILAAIVVPQFTDAASGAQATSMRSQLSTIRSQIEVWRLRNNQNIPGGTSGSPDDLWNALVSDGHLVTRPNLVDGFVWVWNPAIPELKMDFDSSINQVIPDADGDGDGDSADIVLIRSW